MGVPDLLFTGFYPTITWIPFVSAGMALARLDLSQTAVQWRRAALGAALTVAAYRMSLLLAGKDALRSTAEDRPSSGGSGSMPLDSGSLEPHFPASSLFTAAAKPAKYIRWDPTGVGRLHIPPRRTAHRHQLPLSHPRPAPNERIQRLPSRSLRGSGPSPYGTAARPALRFRSRASRRLRHCAGVIDFPLSVARRQRIDLPTR